MFAHAVGLLGQTAVCIAHTGKASSSTKVKPARLKSLGNQLGLRERKL
jgi:hypothetical protein